MRKIAVGIIFTLCAITAWAQDGSAAYVYEKERVAIFPFGDKSQSYRDEGVLVTDLVKDTLVSMQRFEIFDRESIIKTFNEYALELAGALDEDTVISVSRRKGYTKAITGSVTDVKATVERIPNSDRNAISYFVNANITVIDVATGEVIFAEELSSSVSQTVPRTGGSDAARIAAARVSAFSQLRSDVAAAMYEAFPIEVRISARRGKQYYLSVGSDAGVRGGEKFRVYEEGRRLVLTDGSYIGRERIYKATIRVDTASRSNALASVTRGGDIILGDVAEELRIAGIRVGVEMGAHPFAMKAVSRPDATASIFGNTVAAPQLYTASSIGGALRAYADYAGWLVQPGFALGVIAGRPDAIAFDARFRLAVNINLIGESLMLSVAPNIGAAFGLLDMGNTAEESAGDDRTVAAGSSLGGTAFALVYGVRGTLRMTANDYFGLSIYGGYTFGEFADWNVSTSDTDGETAFVGFAEKPTLSLTGVEFGVSFDAYF